MRKQAFSNYVKRLALLTEGAPARCAGAGVGGR